LVGLESVDITGFPKRAKTRKVPFFNEYATGGAQLFPAG
jgi:hypothetical protein